MARDDNREVPELVPEPKLTDEELKAIGARVKEARELLKMSQTALGDAVGIGQPYVSRIERGEGPGQPSLGVLTRIARELGQPFGWIAANEGPGLVARAPVRWEQRDKRRRRNPGGK